MHVMSDPSELVLIPTYRMYNEFRIKLKFSTPALAGRTSAVSRLILSYIRPTMTLKNLRSLSSRATSLAGTVPSHKAYILLHGQHSPRAFPSRLASPLLVALRQRALRWSALVNVAWILPNGSEHFPNLSKEETDGTETYSLLAFASNRRRLRIPSVSMDNFEDACAQLNNF